MKSIKQPIQSFLHHQHVRHARLPWDELEAEAKRQGCSPADIFFDRAGRSGFNLFTTTSRRTDGDTPSAQ
jgi:hypothetical protein